MVREARKRCRATVAVTRTVVGSSLVLRTSLVQVGMA